MSETDLSRAIGPLEGRIEALDRHLAAIDRKLDHLTTAFPHGPRRGRRRGRLGGLLLLVLGGAAWLLDHLPAWLR